MDSFFQVRKYKGFLLYYEKMRRFFAENPQEGGRWLVLPESAKMKEEPKAVSISHLLHVK